MGQELTQANETLLEFERLIQTGGCNAWEGTLRTGVDLGTANTCWRWWMSRTGRWPGPLIPPQWSGTVSWWTTWGRFGRSHI